jgi:hypothetical protein
LCQQPEFLAKHYHIYLALWHRVRWKTACNNNTRETRYVAILFLLLHTWSLLCYSISKITIWMFNFPPRGLPKFKRALWGDKPKGLLPENCPNFSFFLFGPGPFGHLWQAPTLVPGKLKFSQGKGIFLRTGAEFKLCNVRTGVEFKLCNVRREILYRKRVNKLPGIFKRF